MNPPNQHFKDAFKSFGWWAGLNGTEKKTSLSLLVFSLAHGRSFTMVLSFSLGGRQVVYSTSANSLPGGIEKIKVIAQGTRVLSEAGTLGD